MPLLKSHHNALCRGYIHKGCGYIEEYSGRFGTGFIYHYPNCEFNKSNRYHVIEYLIFVK